ncbi:MAG TPA: helix-turn-helix transcriptional regulator [Ramlibacter sp.]|jgi:transcriptional regulator with XRE-family HTH domain
MLKVSDKSDEMVELRVKGGRWLKSLRESAGMSQSQVAKALGLEFYTFISQLESGRGRVPSAQYAAFAKAYNVPLREFTKTLLSFYEPAIYYALFEHEESPEELERMKQNMQAVEPDTVANLASRLAKLEAKLLSDPRKR